MFGVKHAHHLIGHVILNSVIFAIDKWLKPNLNISLTWFQVTLKILTSYGVALIKSYTDGLPKHNSLCSLCDLFSGYFKDKITRIQSSFPVHMLNKVEVQPPPISSLLSSFTPATAEEVRQIIMSSPNKFCDLDPMLTVLLKACIDTLLGTITNIVNVSLRTGIFPHDFKQAHVNPLLKKTTLSKDNLKNYRPVSNLSFISKILEKVVAKRLGSHITSNNLSNVFQSAYKKLLQRLLS